MDELLKERYDLAKDRIVEICTETTVKPDFLDFFQNMAAFLEKTAVILERDEEKLSIEELQKENTELYKELFPQNYTHTVTGILHTQKKNSVNMEGHLHFFTQNFVEQLPMHMKKKSGIIQ